MVANPGLADLRGHLCSHGRGVGTALCAAPALAWSVPADITRGCDRGRGGDGHALRLSFGGQAALPLAAALMGVTAVAVVLNRQKPQTGPLGVAIAGLFCVLLIGRFFGELTTAHAVVLYAPPCWPGSPSCRLCAGHRHGGVGWLV